MTFFSRSLLAYRLFRYIGNDECKIEDQIFNIYRTHWGISASPCIWTKSNKKNQENSSMNHSTQQTKPLCMWYSLPISSSSLFFVVLYHCKEKYTRITHMIRHGDGKSADHETIHHHRIVVVVVFCFYESFFSRKMAVSYVKRTNVKRFILKKVKLDN